MLYNLCEMDLHPCNNFERNKGIGKAHSEWYSRQVLPDQIWGLNSTSVVPCTFSNRKFHAWEQTGWEANKKVNGMRHADRLLVGLQCKFLQSVHLISGC